MGGQMMIRVENVTIVESNKKYSDVFHALFALDFILSDGKWLDYDFKITERDIKIMKGLLFNDKTLSFDGYIQMMFKSFIKNKKQITLNMYGLNRITKRDNGKELVSFIIEDEIKKERINKDFDFSKISSKYNLITSAVFDMFPSTTNIIINQGTFDKIFVFDLFMFLEIILKSDTWKIIKIKQMVEVKNKSWLYLYYNSCLSSLESEYKRYGLKIQFESVQDEDGDYDEYLIISRI